jgi:hypothetical protein
MFALIIFAGALSATTTASPLVRSTAVVPAGVAQTPASTNQNALAAGENFKGFRFGANLRDFYQINKVRPLTSSHVAGDEEGCQFYSPASDIQIGDFRIKQADIYLIFYKDRLLRVRIINTLNGRDEPDVKFFTGMRTALTQKYGNAPSKDQIFTKFDGRYEWKTETLRVSLSYSMLEYGWIELEKDLASANKQNTQIKSSDI